MTPLYISYFTRDTPYESEAAELAVTLRQFGLPHDIQGIDARGSWNANAGHKPTFIRDMMLQYDGRPLVFLDADARVVKPPVLFGEINRGGFDFAAHWLNDHELISACLYFAPTRPAWELVRKWQAEVAANPNQSTADQACLQAVVENSPGLNQYRLPPTYNWISGGRDCDISEQMYGKMEPTIVQTQASRRFRKTVS